MLKIAGLRNLRVVTRRAPSIEHARHSTRAQRTSASGISQPRSVGNGYAEPATDGQRLCAAGLHQPASVAGLTSSDTRLATMAERMRADGVNQPSPVGAESSGLPATDAQRLCAAGLHQPASVAGLTSSDTGLATMAERMRADGINS